MLFLLIFVAVAAVVGGEARGLPARWVADNRRHKAQRRTLGVGLSQEPVHVPDRAARDSGQRRQQREEAPRGGKVAAEGPQRAEAAVCVPEGRAEPPVPEESEGGHIRPAINIDDKTAVRRKWAIFPGHLSLREKEKENDCRKSCRQGSRSPRAER